MTRIASSLKSAPTIEQARTPAGGPTADLTHGTKAQACRGPISSEFGASTSVTGNQFASEACPRPQRVEGPPSIQRAFETLNAPRMRRDWLQDCTAPQLLWAWATLALGTLLLAHIGTPILFRIFELTIGVPQ